MKKNSVLFYLVLLLSASSIANAQTITSIAGNGVLGYGGDGAAATACSFYNPTWITQDNTGNYYITDRQNHRLRKINTAGVITTVAGTGTSGYTGDGGPATAAKLARPTAVITDNTGNIYISDYDNHRIRKINTSGIISTFAGTGTFGFSGDGGPATAAQLDHPYGLALDAAGNMIVADEYNHCIRKISTSGIITTIAGSGGTSGFVGDGGPATDALLYYPHYITLDNAGNLFITDNSNHRIRKINTTGTINTIAGTGSTGFSGDGGPATAASINWCGGLATDAAGNLYIADHNNNRIRKVNTSGIISTYAGTGVATSSGDGGAPLSAGINTPADVYINALGEMFIPEFSTPHIRKISLNNPPYFTGGASDTFIICHDVETVTVSSLGAADVDSGQTLTWLQVTAPTHGTVTGVPYSTTATGDTITPLGIYYHPAAGYTGTDSFTVSVSDGMAADTLVMYFTIMPSPDAGTISLATDTLCLGDTSVATSLVPGGVWDLTNTTVATISATGTLTASAAGADTINYSVAGFCGIAVAQLAIYVQSAANCHVGISQDPSTFKSSLQLYPNPASGHVTVHINTLGKQVVNVGVWDITGKQLAEYSLPTNMDNELPVNLATGTYVVGFDSADGFTAQLLSVMR